MSTNSQSYHGYETDIPIEHFLLCVWTFYSICV